ncbi:hypothetical protein ANN_02235 [Periplaneta americana]|uniref:R3H domain-containing protein n=1 Tax=Periplaneta americana TaxID=6978 RepID=A0ABQ8TVP5_PERAM|nr:hypothetical protein ANN_02235 [Periplaneta americana]
MANWDGSYFGGDKQNYNYLPSGYTGNNVQSFPCAPVDWTYYSMPGPVPQAPIDGFQPLSGSVFTNQPLHTMFRMPFTSQYPEQNSPDANRNALYGMDQIGSSSLNPSEANLAMAVSSSLTPTAGEFVPRPTSHHADTKGGNGVQGFEASNRKPSGERLESSVFYSNCDRGQAFRKQGESKYFNSNRNRDNFSGRGNSHGMVQHGSTNSKSYDMEKAKNQDRQRLLAEAAAFLIPSKNTDSAPALDVDSNLTVEVKQHTSPSGNKEGSRNSSYPSRQSADTFHRNTSRNHIPQQQESFYSKRRNEGSYSGNFHNQKYGIGSTSSETFDNGNGNKQNYQQRFRTHNNGSNYRGGASQSSSPRKEVDQYVDRIGSVADSGWRCPACQNVTAKIPYEYRCFCGKVREPEWNRVDAAHTCGQMCGRSRTDKRPDCTHRCTLLCHAGPCPPCASQVSRSCGCGKKMQIVKCGSDQPLLCGAECGKALSCGVHQCNKKCHIGNCSECQELITQVCYCGKVTREVPCTQESSVLKYFSCEGSCEKKLSCGNHHCNLKCHSGPCPDCEFTPEKVTHCPCGKTSLAGHQVRISCLDPIPTCDQKCNRELPCGQPNYIKVNDIIVPRKKSILLRLRTSQNSEDRHTCQLDCHIGPCPACPLTTMVKCRCGNMDREIPCEELTEKATDARCEKRCTKKRSCGKHKCNQFCCIDQDHICPLPCNHQLSCGQHRCEETCHRGHCPPCWRTSFDELYCECGASVLYPPVPCGTRRPECTKPCSRPHSCEHPALHNCHSEPSCPPCTVLTQKYCYGKHEDVSKLDRSSTPGDKTGGEEEVTPLRKSVPCHQKELSCGLPCNVSLPCGHHRCILPCHKGPCLKEDQICTQPCTTPRSLCGHNCAAPCHDGTCPDTPCKEMVKVTCECGHRSVSRACSDNAKEYQRIATSLLASKMADMQLGHSVDIADLLGNPSARKMSLKTLDCSEECRIIERNRRLAIGLQIRNPDLSAKLTPRYSDFMRQWAKKDPHFCNMVHEKLTELVQLAKQSKQKSRSYSFDSMNRDKRHFVHEYCEHFGCESVAYDQEPKRNVVATASRDKAWLPSMSLLEVIQRESGQRKIPKPVISTTRTPSQRTMDILPVKCSQSQAVNVTPKASNSSSAPKSVQEEDEIDYFDFP